MAKRHTPYLIYVDKSIMDKPGELFMAAFDHMKKKNDERMKAGKRSTTGQVARKRFMTEVWRAGTDDLKLEVIDEWIQVRNAETYPWKKGDKGESAEPEGGVPVGNGDEPESGASSE